MTPITVLVVDDSVVVRRLVTTALEADPAIQVVGSAANGRIALTKAQNLRPDLITMDIEMPEMDGIDAVRELRATGHRQPIIMFSTLTERGAVATLDALAAGATDYVTKPTGTGSLQESLARVAEELLPRIKALVPRPSAPTRTVSRSAKAPARPTAAPVRLLAPANPAPVQAVVVGSSTGGPEALSRLLGGLTEPLPVPMVVVQHMPPVFTRQLAARLDRLGPSTVLESAGGEALRPGFVYIAPGDHHLQVVRSAGMVHTRLDQGPPVNYCRPSVDVLFASVAATFGDGTLAIVLTGMGSDGRSGSEQVITGGGQVVIQDEASCVVWGMPGAVATGPGAHAVVPLDAMATTVARAVADPASVGGGSWR